MVIKFLYLIFFVNFFNVVNSTFICSSNHTVKLSADKMFFFQSLNFPNNFSKVGNDNFCQINFLLDTDMMVTNKRFYLVLTNIINTNERTPLNMSSIVSIQTFYTFKKSFFDESFQGFALFDDWGDSSCPLESISRMKPFYFLDESQIIALNSTYFLNFSRKHPCFWQFSAPSNFGFKIVFTNLNLSNLTDLKVENSTDIIWTQHNVKPLHPYYNVDKFLQISLSLGAINYDLKEMEFSAYITIVKKEWKNSECTVIQNFNEWHSLFGYPNNAKCKYELIIPFKTEVLITSALDFEKNVDYLQYSFEDDNETIILDSNTVLFGYTDNDTNNNSEKNVSFELITDGSVNKGGFELDFEYIKCECANPTIIVECDIVEQKYYLMKYNKSNAFYTYNDYYCGNLNCNFTILPSKKCPNKFISMEMSLTFSSDTFFDSFRIYTNNTVTTEIAFLQPHGNGWFFDTILSPYVENIFEALTLPSTDITKTLTLFFTPIEAPEIKLSIILIPENLEFNAKINFDNHLVTAELSSELLLKGYTMEIYGDLNYATFYEKENMAHKIALNHCPHNSDLDECQMTKDRVIVYIYAVSMYYDHPPYPVYLFFRAVNRNFSHCSFNNDVFYLDHIYRRQRIKNKKAGISTLASHTGICKIYLLTWETSISNFWTTAQNGTVILYSGNDKEKLLEFNQSTAHIWKNILSFQQFYTVEIPINASLLVSLDQREDVYINSFPFKSVLNFPFTSDFTNSSYQPIQIFVENYNVKFTVTKFNISENYGMSLIFENGTEKSFSSFQNIEICAPINFTILFNYTSNVTDFTWEPNVVVYLETINNIREFLPTSTQENENKLTTNQIRNSTVSFYQNYLKILIISFFIFLY